MTIKMYGVTLDRPRWETAYVEILADSEEQARENVLALSDNEIELLDWNVDSAPETYSITEVEEIPT